MPTPIPENFVNELFGEIFRKLTNGGDPSRLGPNNMILWEPVPYVIDPNAFDFASKSFMKPVASDKNMTPEEYEALRTDSQRSAYAMQEEFARIADEIPSFVTGLDAQNKAREFAVYSSDAGSTISKVYDIILSMSQVLDSKIDPKVQKRIDTLRKKIFTLKTFDNPDFDSEAPEHPDDNPKKITNLFPSKSYLLYNEYMDRYLTASEEMNELQTEAQTNVDAMIKWTNSGKNLQKKVVKAENDWITFGSKVAFDKIYAEIAQLEGTNFVMLKKKYREEFDMLQKTSLDGAKYYYSAPIPAGTLKNRAQWMEFTFNKSSYDYASRQTSHGWKAGGSYLGLVKVGGEGTHKVSTSDFNFEDFELSFKLSKVSVARPWYNESFIKSGYWRMTKDGEKVLTDTTTNKVKPISDGNGGGIMPAICTELYLISDLKLGFKKGSDSYKKTEDHVKAGGSVGFGPFNIGGSYSYNDERVNYSGNREQQGISSKGILLIGRKFAILDKAPNPLPSIKEDEWT